MRHRDNSPRPCMNMDTVQYEWYLSPLADLQKHAPQPDTGL